MNEPNAETTAQANYLWGIAVAHTLAELGLRQVFFSPGSRSTPLVLGFENHPLIESIPVLDERSAAFLALGSSKRTKNITALLCTSGTAPTHWFPAVAEAHHSSVPLLLLSADRPPELQNCGAGQTINQEHLFGSFVRSYHSVALPTNAPAGINSLQKTLITAYSQALGSNPGPVHLNFPFKEPFFPKQTPQIPDLAFDEPDKEKAQAAPNSLEQISKELHSCKRPLIIAGEHAPNAEVRAWLEKAPVPILCDALSGLRENFCFNRILRFENFLRDSIFSKRITPDLVLCLGPLPTSKTLRSWIDESQAKRLIIEPRGQCVDPLKSPSSAFDLAYSFLHELPLPNSEPEWLDTWLNAENSVEEKLNLAFEKNLQAFEGRIARILSEHLPPHCLLHVANSMPIRDMEWFWKPSDRKRLLFGNRGVNGIDGTLGTALGLAHQANKPTYLLSGELAFLHDSNALLFAKTLKGSLTALVINNNGGGIFEHLPIAEKDEFEKCFATPQEIDFESLCKAHQVEYRKLQDVTEIKEAISNPTPGLRILEIQTDRKSDSQTRARLLGLGPL